MKISNLLASLAAVMMVATGLHGQNLKPGTVTFKNIYGSVVSHNSNTGATEEITTESLLTEGFVVETHADGYLDLVFSNGVVGRLAPNSRVLIESFATTGGRTNRDNRMDLESARSRSTGSTTANLHLLIECGDIVINATEKEEGELLVKTPTATVNSELAKFFVSHGKSNAVNQSVSRAINLGNTPIDVSSRMNGEFTDNNDQVAYGYWDPYADDKRVTLNLEASAVVISEDETEPTDQVAGSDLEKPVTTDLRTDQWNTNNSMDAMEDACDKAKYTLLPYDPCVIDRLSFIGDHVLYGGSDPQGSVLITAAAEGATYFNVQSSEVGDLEAGMMVPEDTIIRSPSDGSITGVFPNGAIVEVQPGANAYLESISTQPVLSDPIVDNQTNIQIRVESGQVVVNTLGTPQLDTFAVISPLDRHSIQSNTVVAVEFLQLDTSAFQTVSQNRTPEGANGVNTVVVSDGNLSFASDTVTFIEYAENGNDFAFTTPPSYAHITESAIIPPGYEFIDRTIAFAASTIPAPNPNISTPDPGTFQRFTDEEDPVSP